MNCRNPYFIGILSAIQAESLLPKTVKCRNPYFIGILSAIEIVEIHTTIKNVSQSLFYWNPFCNKRKENIRRRKQSVAILILLESFLQ